MKKINQQQRIIQYINDFGSITNREAMYDLGIGDMRKRISELRRKGYAIDDKREIGVNRYGEKTEYKRYFFTEGAEYGRLDKTTQENA